ncbi:MULTISPECIES: extracellular solute-binding protein [Paenibacillus]|uniref:Extracellular solute-binding protein family 1 n=2 Tax=Paenibacillus lactis TaxID=228574 RepID=G4HMP5_9BACL|nr:extracellular solute-binding protein [Paenibacillus lactis]EHB54455.1 extracellular solute-binding protein family 1 [Paenibacillus lactis 154]MBP1892441.1 ABC-type glycerol-3-phosphate transport system substrate-binding protein [Paenibacillus lactis]MCM3493183.1 ABC transporter substrate-binding protein [Paenibacillus lactis]HAF97008.1 ABC transporter substrate-binding protein [Paenibacillus lactis]
MKKKVKHRLSIILSTVLASTLILSGCGNSGSESGAGKADNGVTTIKYYNWDNEAQQAGTDAMLQEFMDQNPDIKVEHVVLVPGDSVEMLKKLDFLISSGEAIDVIQFPSLGGVLERAERGALAPLNEFYEKESLVPEDEYFVNPKLGDKYYGMQYTKSTNYVMLNKDALDEAGLEVPKYGWTWDDYREYAKKLTKGEGVDKRYGSYFHTWELYMNAPAQTMMKDPFVYEDGTTILADPTYKYFFQLRKDMEEKDKSAKPYSDVLAAKLNYRTEFFNEEAAMILTGNFTIADPGNTEQYPHEFKTAFAPVPVPPAGWEPKEYEGKYFTSGNMLAMGANSANKAASFKLMRFMTTADSDNRLEFSGYKKANNEELLTKLVAGKEDMYDMDSLKYTLFSDEIQYLDAAKVMIASTAELTKIINDGFSKFMLSNEPIDEVQQWMVDEATKIINEKGVIK